MQCDASDGTGEWCRLLAQELKAEAFGPVLHIVRWRAGKLDALVDDIVGNGYGLTRYVAFGRAGTAAAMCEFPGAGSGHASR